METIIFDFFSKNYKIDKPFRCYMILDIHGDVKHHFDFIEEIKTIFFISIENVIDVTEKWKNKFFSESDLNDYWKYGGSGKYMYRML